MLALVGICCVWFQTSQTFGATSSNVSIVLCPAKRSATMNIAPVCWNHNNVALVKTSVHVQSKFVRFSSEILTNG